jgi:hypothetical protein
VDLQRMNLGSAPEARALLRACWRLWRLRRSLRALRALEAQGRAEAAVLEEQRQYDATYEAWRAETDAAHANARLQAQSQMASNPYAQQVLAQNAASWQQSAAFNAQLANSPAAVAHNRAFAECTCNGSIVYDEKRDELRPARRCPLHR